jgi:imidazolonepropionase-like amidohydrolase
VYENAALLHAAGVRFGMRLGDPHRLRDLTTEAGIAVAYGLPYGVAVAAISGTGPGLWGLDVGQIKVGHRGSCVLTDGDPLQPRSRVLGVWMDGAPLPLVDRQTGLYERFRTLR